MMQRDETEPGSRCSAYRARGVENRKSPDALILTKDNICRKDREQFESPHGSSEGVIKGRDLWALRKRVRTGALGVTPIESPGPRWSPYVYNLRALGFHFETVHEPHGGPYTGTHARYVLQTPVKVIGTDGCDGPAS